MAARSLVKRPFTTVGIPTEYKAGFDTIMRYLEDRDKQARQFSPWAFILAAVLHIVGPDEWADMIKWAKKHGLEAPDQDVWTRETIREFQAMLRSIEISEGREVN